MMLIALAAGCRQNASVPEPLVPLMEDVPIISKIEIPVFFNDDANKAVQVYAIQHNAILASFELLKQNRIDEGLRLFAKSQRYYFNIPDMIPIHKVPGLLSDKEKTAFSKFFKEIGEESEPMTKWFDDFMKQHPEAKAQVDTLIKALLSEENTSN
jgi:hypothetical protein